MDSLDTALRLMVIGQIVLTILVLAARRLGPISLSLVLLQLGVIAFLIKSSPELLAAAPYAEVPLMWLSMATPYFVWFCAYVLFEFERPSKWLMVALAQHDLFQCAAWTASSTIPRWS